MYLFAQNRVQKYLGAIAARLYMGFRCVINRGSPNLVLTWVVTAPNQPPQYMIVILVWAESAAELDLQAKWPVHLVTMDITLYLQLIFKH